MNHVETRVAGIPCKVRVDTYWVTKGNYSPRAETPEEYHGMREIEFTVLDRRGREAPWLERKLTDEDRQRIENEIITASEKEAKIY